MGPLIHEAWFSHGALPLCNSPKNLWAQVAATVGVSTCVYVLRNSSDWFLTLWNYLDSVCWQLVARGWGGKKCRLIRTKHSILKLNLTLGCFPSGYFPRFSNLYDSHSGQWHTQSGGRVSQDSLLAEPVRAFSQDAQSAARTPASWALYHCSGLQRAHGQVSGCGVSGILEGREATRNSKKYSRESQFSQTLMLLVTSVGRWVKLTPMARTQVSNNSCSISRGGWHRRP